MVSHGGGGLTGTYFLFSTATLLDPSTRTMYSSNCRTLMPEPVLSHLVGWGTVWFCNIHTWSPTARGERRLVCSDLHVPVPEGLFECSEHLLPSDMWSIPAREYGYDVLDWSPKDAHGRGELDIWVRGFTVLEYRALDGVGVQLPIGTSVVIDEAFDCLHVNFGPTVAVRGGH